MRVFGCSRWMRRMVWRTSSSAVAVTVQVFNTTKSASSGLDVAVNPFAAKPPSIAVPSACDARQPKFLTRKRSTVLQCNLAVNGILFQEPYEKNHLRNRPGLVRLRHPGSEQARGSPALGCRPHGHEGASS